MNIILALLAFAITMIVMSTLVVVIVEVIKEARGMRKRYLTYLLGAVFDEYIWPSFKDKLPKDDAGQQTFRFDSSAELRATKSWVVVAANIFNRKPRLSWLTTLVLAAGFVLYAQVALGLIVVIGAAYLADRAGLLDRIDYPVLPLADRAGAQQLRALMRLEQLREIQSDDGLRGPPRDQNGIWQRIGDAFQRMVAWLQGQSPRGGDVLVDGNLSRRELAELQRLEARTDLNSEALRMKARELRKRRIFIAETAKVAKSVAADPTADRTAFSDLLSATDFAAQLARTEFGAAIQEAAGEKLETVLNEAARRFDAIGKDTRETFRGRMRHWSIGVAFVLALVVNVDALTLLDTYYRNPALAEKVEQAYAGRIDELEARVAAAGAWAEPSTTADELKEKLAALKETIDAASKEVKAEVEGLAELGVPVGASRYPYCDAPSFAALDRRCLAVAKRHNLIADRKEYKDMDFQKARPSTDGSDETPPSLGFQYYLELAEGKRGAAPGPLSVIAARWEAAMLWYETRKEAGLTGWLFGVLLGGALIGLGGPFWFDFYRRIASVASIARSFGLQARPIPRKDRDPEDAEQDPETAHQPKNVVDAFETAIEAREAIAASRDDHLIHAAETSSESPPRSRPRPELTPDGDIAG